MRRRCAITLLLLIFKPALLAADPPVRVLFIGNSYTAGIRPALQQFVKASPHREAHLEFITPGGKDLLFHSDQAKTIARIRDGQWDIVVLQDQSQTPAVLPDRFFKGAAKLHKIIAESGARTAYYETWGRRDGDRMNKEQLPTYERMQDVLSAAYRKASKRDKGLLVPVGTAWRRVRKLHPQLGRELYRKDGSHPSASGAYLATICFYARLFDADPDKVNFTGEITADVATKLRAAAMDVLNQQ